MSMQTVIRETVCCHTVPSKT